MTPVLFFPEDLEVWAGRAPGEDEEDEVGFRSPAIGVVEEGAGVEVVAEAVTFSGKSPTLSARDRLNRFAPMTIW